MPLGSFSNQKRGESYSYFQNINYLPKLLHFSGHFQHTHHTADWLWCVRVPEVVLPEQTPTLSDEHDWSISDTLSRRHSIQRALGVPELVRACLPRVNKSSDECAFPGIDCLLKVSQPTCMSKDYHQLMKKKKKKLEGRHLQWKLAAATFFHRKATLISKLNCVCTHRTNCIIGI